jgi:hypothetical protein
METFDLKLYTYLTIKSPHTCTLTSPRHFLSLTFFTSAQHLCRFVYALAEGGLLVFIVNKSFILSSRPHFPVKGKIPHKNWLCPDLLIWDAPLSTVTDVILESQLARGLPDDAAFRAAIIPFYYRRVYDDTSRATHDRPEHYATKGNLTRQQIIEFLLSHMMPMAQHLGEADRQGGKLRFACEIREAIGEGTDDDQWFGGMRNAEVMSQICRIAVLHNRFFVSGNQIIVRQIATFMRGNFADEAFLDVLLGNYLHLTSLFRGKKGNEFDHLVVTMNGIGMELLRKVLPAPMTQWLAEKLLDIKCILREGLRSLFAEWATGKRVWKLWLWAFKSDEPKGPLAAFAAATLFLVIPQITAGNIQSSYDFELAWSSFEKPKPGDVAVFANYLLVKSQS